LKIAGIKWYCYWLSNMARSFLVYFFLSILVTIIGSIELNPRTSLDPNYSKKSLFEYTHFTVVLTTCLIYSIQSTLFTLLIAQMFSKRKRLKKYICLLLRLFLYNNPFKIALAAKLAAIIIWLITAINFYDNLPTSSLKYLFCVFPNAALNFAFQVILQYERSGLFICFVFFLISKLKFIIIISFYRQDTSSRKYF
jgi:hypothetical protein